MKEEKLREFIKSNHDLVKGYYNCYYDRFKEDDWNEQLRILFVNALSAGGEGKVGSKAESIEKFERIILYCPTYRDDHSLRFPISEKELNDLEKLLQESNSLFLMKGHYFVQNIDFEQYDNIKIAPISSDIQELYFITDILITDYSSTMLDFSLLDRPILLFPYDLDEYKRVRGMYYNLEDIAPGIDEYMLRQPVGVVAIISPLHPVETIPLLFLLKIHL